MLRRDHLDPIMQAVTLTGWLESCDGIVRCRAALTSLHDQGIVEAVNGKGTVVGAVAPAA